MIRNREIKALLDRSEARRVAVSPLAQHPLGQSGIQLAAIEIAKAIATGFRTDLHDHIISLDLSGATIVEAPCRGAPAMSALRPQEAARPAPGADADRARAPATSSS